MEAGFSTTNPGSETVRIIPTEPEEPDVRPDEFDRFEDLTRKLVNVPKSELDEERENESQDHRA